MMTGSAMRIAMASRSPRRCPDARVPGTRTVVVLVISDSSGPTTRTLAAEAERILGGGTDVSDEAGAGQFHFGPRPSLPMVQ
jgi:hypothetical protein